MNEDREEYLALIFNSIGAQTAYHWQNQCGNSIFSRILNLAYWKKVEVKLAATDGDPVVHNITH